MDCHVPCLVVVVDEFDIINWCSDTKVVLSNTVTNISQTSDCNTTFATRGISNMPKIFCYKRIERRQYTVIAEKFNLDTPFAGSHIEYRSTIQVRQPRIIVQSHTHTIIMVDELIVDRYSIWLPATRSGEIKFFSYTLQVNEWRTRSNNTHGSIQFVGMWLGILLSEPRDLWDRACLIAVGERKSMEFVNQTRFHQCISSDWSSEIGKQRWLPFKIVSRRTVTCFAGSSILLAWRNHGVNSSLVSNYLTLCIHYHHVHNSNFSRRNTTPTSL